MESGYTTRTLPARRLQATSPLQPCIQLSSAPAEFVPVSDSNGKFTEFVWQRLHVTLRYDRYYTRKQRPLGDKDEADGDADGRVNIRIR